MIVIDARMYNASGIGTYIRNLVPLVIKRLPGIRFGLIGSKPVLAPVVRELNRDILIIESAAPVYSLSEQVDFFRKLPHQTKLLWSPHYNIPVFHKGKLLVTVHDVFHLAMPKFVSGLHRRLYAKLMFSAITRKAHTVLFVSEFTRQEFTRLVGPPRGYSKAIHLGVDSVWYNVNKVAPPHGNPYLLFIGNVKPHKNLMNLLSAFYLLTDEIPHDLVIVGKKEGFITGDKQAVTIADKQSGRIHFTGFVDDETLRQYCAYATALILPSLYEGFGLPPVEAMACGCPVIVSDTASLPEVCGDAAIYFNPYDPIDIAEKIRNLINNSDLQETLRQKGLKRARLFNWDKCADEIVDAIKMALAA